jgi:HD-GYP domain-containing protein (c-di-GMP phosphodiesterase class II)
VGVTLLVLGLLATALALRFVPMPALALAPVLYALVALWAEVAVVPPKYAGWPSGLFMVMSVNLLASGPGFVVPTVLLALAVRTSPRWTVRRAHGWSFQCSEVGAWLLAVAAAIVVTHTLGQTLRRSAMADVLFSPTFGELGKLTVGLTWAIVFTLVVVGAGTLAARSYGHTWRDLALLTRVLQGLHYTALRVLGVWGIVLGCDVALTGAGDPLVAGSVALGLGWLSWHARQRQRHNAVLAGLAAAVEAKDAYTGDHLEAVADDTARVAAALGLPAAAVEAYGRAALLHDLGKLAVSNGVLGKPGPLDPEEWQEMRGHATTGRALLRALSGFATAAAIAGHHHERWDGQGYPDRLAGTAIPLAARIVTVVDAFGAMTTDRPYRRGTSVEAALAEIQQQTARQFDPDVAAAFLRVMRGPARPPLWQFFMPVED